ncbi:hypothetical protein ABDD95_20635 [Mucilaginibacter sp. PAMB04274]|uniref:hypothetical protein n=1 Tax=Mucilaginibacter sp. PAMB04274 TaxID=3138568 RepID=UPI0031F616B5
MSVNLDKQEAKLTKLWEKDNNGVPDANGYIYYRGNWMEDYLHLGGYQYRQQYREE